MAHETLQNKPDKNDGEKAVNYTSEQGSKNKGKLVRKKYSCKSSEIHVRNRPVENNANKTANYCDTNNEQYFGLVTSASTMFYPPCSQYYPIRINNSNTAIQVQYPMYNLQSIPIVVNPLLSTQIRPYPAIVTMPAVTVANAFSPAVSEANEFSFQMSEVSPICTPHEMSPVYCDMSQIVGNISSGYSNLTVANKVALPGTPQSNYSPFTTNLLNEMAATPLLQEYSPTVSYQFTSLGTPMSDYFSSIQIPNEFIPICTTVPNEFSPTRCDYNSLSYFECELPKYIEDENEARHAEPENMTANSLEFYLSLPKDLFPTARMLTIDPNPLIDEFCKVADVDDHSWILDLEFGVPKSPVTRRVAIYNVKYNSIHCKNTPEAIHPGFERCDKSLQRALMFYYDCVISNWYRGYILMRSDGSVENFQSWLLLPMQVLGMCWP